LSICLGLIIFEEKLQSMALEIERKFIVNDDSYKTIATGCVEISQFYLSLDPDRTVRVRVKGDRGYLTIKGINHGCVRSEWEYEIPVEEARQIMAICTAGLSKRRWLVPYDGLTWEVDEFTGRHEGLVIAEVELPSADTPISLPSFVGREVTGDAAYYNSTLTTAK
jgi:adenylate cyclase